MPDEIKGFLLSLSGSDQDSVLAIIRTLSPSSNSLRVIIDLLKDISHRDGTQVSKILSDILFKDILSLGVSSKEKLVKLKTSLERKRYPEKYRIEQELEELVDLIKANYGIKVALPVDLEGDQLEVKFTFRTESSLLSTSERLRDLSLSTELKTLLAKLKGEI